MLTICKQKIDQIGAWNKLSHWVTESLSHLLKKRGNAGTAFPLLSGVLLLFRRAELLLIRVDEGEQMLYCHLLWNVLFYANLLAVKAYSVRAGAYVAVIAIRHFARTIHDAAHDAYLQALEKTGVSALVSQTLVDSLGALGPTALLAGIYFTTSLMTMFISNINKFPQSHRRFTRIVCPIISKKA